jgi:glycosyltransferase involved in cell wall biosynthesis
MNPLQTECTPAAVPAAPESDAAVPGRRDQALRLSCVVPCWNEAANLAELLPLLAATLAELAAEWEVILVDDGSTDETAMLLAAWARRPGFRALLLSRNFGKEAALTAGLQAAAGDAVIMLDADLQHPPALLAAMVAHWRRGADVVYAVRENRDDESAFKRLGARWFYRLMNAADRFEVPPGGGDFRLLDRAAVDALLALPERNRFMKGLYAWVGFDAVALPYTPHPRAHGSTRFRPWRLIRLSLDGLTAFTTWPLRAVSVTGTVLALLAFAYGSFLIGSYLLSGNEVSGWTTIVVSLMFFVGVQLVSIGILGEYVGRIFEEVKGRPLYIVKRDLGRGLEPPPR